TSRRISSPPRRRSDWPVRRPSSSGSLPSWNSRINSEPSGRATTAVRRRPAPLSSAKAPMGTWHPPPSCRSSARSQLTVARVARWSRNSVAARVSVSPERISMARAPWPTAGHITLGGRIVRMRSVRPRRTRPAAARMMASYSPSSSLRRRVSTLPRSGRTLRSGRRARSCAWRRRLLVPTRALGQARQRVKVARQEGIARVLAASDGGDVKLGRNLRGQVLQTMDGEVHAAREQRFLDLLGEHALGADLGEGHIPDLVAGGLDDFDFNLMAADAKFVSNVAGLPKSEL